ncbi:SDR family NAD(P)-dependent oxidoreductase [Desulfovibrio sp. ZJ200]|uniref:SDR family NAD(P)-dependent oxidoreductase n=1 Tax=Desulfovibrio sp. ZJ200 TaxID=2709792 RepID=UPI0013ED2F04|nr:SDR family NAD(P)-dependent oxidoreductase [Desulfovibrio sp. ZJ200]
MKKIFLSIGTGPGIGLSTAIRFAKEGFHPVLTARNPERLRGLADEVRQATGQEAEAVRLDAGDHRQLVALAERYAIVDVLHYNAAIVHGQSLSQAEYANLAEDVLVGITGCLYALKAFAPAMLARKAGTILLTGGRLALRPAPEYRALGVAKAGIRNMTEALFADFAKQNVHIASVNVTKAVFPRSPEAAHVAELNWKLHSQPQGQWTWEESDD